MKKTKHQLDYINLIIPEEPEKNAEAVPFPCPYYSAFFPKPDADKLFSVLDGLPIDQEIAAHVPSISQPSIQTWKRVSGRLVLTFYDGASEAAKAYVNRFGDCGSFVYPIERVALKDPAQAITGGTADCNGAPSSGCVSVFSRDACRR